ncbi:MAG TPA: ABC transporter substrate-binding protein [Longimicrobium sp.]|nr:ABC transporter substrate-binding protein [Longimicrobium sp.]
MSLLPRFRTFLRAGVLSALVLAPLAGCRKEDGGGGGAGGAASEEKWTVGFSQMGHDNPWRMAQTASLKEEAARRGYELVVTDAQDQTAKQVADVEDLIARRVDVILLAPREFEGLAPALLAAREANIPVILVDREAEGTPGEDFVTFLGSNFIEQGRRAAEWLVKETGGTAGIVELTGTPGSSVAADRAKGFRDVIAQHPGMKILASQTGEFSRANGQRVMQNIAQSLGTQITAVYAHNDEMALGAIQALRASGRTPGTDVKIVSIDGQRAALEAIQRGELGATVESNPRFGPIAFETIEQVRKGEQVPTKKLITDRFFDRTNAAQFVAEAY